MPVDWIEQNRKRLEEEGIPEEAVRDFIGRNTTDGQADYHRVFDALGPDYAPRADGGGAQSGGGGMSSGEWGRPVPLPNLPRYEKPPAFSYEAYTPSAPWQAPSIGDIASNPEYQWITSQGSDAIQRWKAAKGTLNSSDTALALQDFGQQSANQFYGDIWNRSKGAYELNEQNRQNVYGMNRAGALSTYNTNYGTQYVDPYRFEYQRETDLFAPQMTQYQTEADFGMQARGIQGQQDLQTQSLNYSDSFNRWLAAQNQRNFEKEFGWRVQSED